MTTLIDVTVKPCCQTYRGRAQDRIAEGSGDQSFLIMQSNGGIVSTTGGVVNPTSTVCALALRAAEHLRDEFADLRCATRPLAA